MTKESSKYDETLKIGSGESVKTKTFYNPFDISPEVYALLVEVNDTNRERIKNKITELITEQHGHNQIQFLSVNSTLLQISVADWAEHLIKNTGNPEPWYAPAGTTVGLIHDPQHFVKLDDGTYDHREYEIKEMGPRDNDVGREPDDEGPDGDEQRLRDRVRQGVIDDLRKQWGADTTQALDDDGRVVTLTAEQVADRAMQSHYEQGMKDLNQPFSKRPAEQDIRTIYGKSASDMRGSVRVNGVETYADHNGNIVIDEIAPSGSPIRLDYGSYGWSHEKLLRRGSKTVPKPVRKVTLREKAKAQRRARRKSR